MIETHNLSKTFDKFQAVENLTLSVQPGEIFGLLGPNGAGKTTTMRMLACLIAPSEGQATLCGYDVHRPPDEVRRSLGILSEPAGLYENLSAWRNLAYFAKLYDLEPSFAQSQIEKYLK